MVGNSPFGLCLPLASALPFPTPCKGRYPTLHPTVPPHGSATGGALARRVFRELSCHRTAPACGLETGCSRKEDLNRLQNTELDAGKEFHRGCDFQVGWPFWLGKRKGNKKRLSHAEALCPPLVMRPLHMDAPCASSALPHPCGARGHLTGGGLWPLSQPPP